VGPSDSPEYACGLVHAEYPPASSWHWNVTPDWPVKEKLAEVWFVGFDGALVIVGAVGATAAWISTPTIVACALELVDHDPPIGPLDQPTKPFVSIPSALLRLSSLISTEEAWNLVTSSFFAWFRPTTNAFPVLPSAFGVTVRLVALEEDAPVFTLVETYGVVGSMPPVYSMRSYALPLVGVALGVIVTVPDPEHPVPRHSDSRRLLFADRTLPTEAHVHDRPEIELTVGGVPLVFT
jgi:hypothetical protein